MTVRYTVAEHNTGRTVLSILRSELLLSASLIRRLKRCGGITVSGTAAFTNSTVMPGETVEACVTAGESATDIPPERGKLNIIYENAGLIAVNKPPGLLTHPSRSRYTGTLANFVAGYLTERDGIARCHAVNRLDRDTSGIVLFATNGHVKALSIAALAAGEKEYLALCYGAVSPERGVIDLPIRRVREGDMLRAVLPDGQRAVTRYETLRVRERGGASASLLQLTLETGRTHQIRVHLSAVGHPILGDGLYGTHASRALSAELGISAQTLHAHRLSFRDPITGEAVTLIAEPPEWARMQTV